MSPVTRLLVQLAGLLLVSPAALAAVDRVAVELRNPQSAPSGLGADLIGITGAIICESKTFMLSTDQFDFDHQRADIPVVAGEQCVITLRSMTLLSRLDHRATVTYVSTDKSHILAINARQLVAPENSAVSLDATKPLATHNCHCSCDSAPSLNVIRHLL